MNLDPMEDPYNADETPDVEIITCPSCARQFPEDQAGRVGYRWLCPVCYGAHPVVVGATMAAIRADEDECPF